MKVETKCVHGGTLRDDLVGGINSPLYTSSAFAYVDRPSVPYPRYFNTPNQAAVVEKLCTLEGAEGGVLFSSGMAAMSTSLLAFASAGDHIVLMDELYGGTHSFATKEFERFDMKFTFAPTGAEEICGAVRADTKVMVIESPTNPLLSIVDIEKIARFARGRGVVTVMDNTFATPVNQNPLALGIDVVVHSGTKYLGGHSDICCGVALSDREKALKIRGAARHLGGSLNAATAHLLERSLKTLALRVGRQTENAGEIARFLQHHDAVKKVNYPGLEDHDGHDAARRQMSGFGGMLSFELAGKEEADLLVRRVKLIRPAVSLGGVESTICSPAVTSHATMTTEERERIGVTEALLRLSVGIENAGDLIDDLRGAIES